MAIVDSQTTVYSGFNIARWLRNAIALVSILTFATPLYGQVGVITSKDTVSSSGPLCGLYALLGSAECLQVEVDHDTLFDNRFVGSEQGSSALELCRAANAIGLQARAYKGMTVESLKSSTSPLILHLNRSRYQTNSRHWVLYLGDESGTARVFDAPASVTNRAYADLLAEWDGVAIQVSHREDRKSTNAWTIGPLRPVLVLLVFSFTFFLKLWMPRCRQQDVSWIGSAGLFVAVAFFANVYHSMLPIGMHRNPSAVALVAKYHVALNLPEISTREMVELIRDNNTENVAIVDARSFTAYRLGHLPGALCVPVNSPPEQLSATIKKLSGASQVVVYCQSRACAWDEVIARHLVLSGLRDVVLYRGGWQEWQEYHLEN